MDRWTRISTPLLVVAAIVPLNGIASGEAAAGVDPTVDLLCWGVFLVDLLVRIRYVPGYLSTRTGRVDLAIVVVTVPLYAVVPGFEGTDVVVLARLLRLARMAFISLRGSEALRILRARLGVAGIYALAILLTASLIVDRVERPVDGFDGFGDGLWWSIVTLTTVGYGDAVPQTGWGRSIAVVLMISGIALLGVLAGALAAVFGLDDEATEPPLEADGSSTPRPGVSSDDVATASLAEQVRALTLEVERLRRVIDEAGDRSG